MLIYEMSFYRPHCKFGQIRFKAFPEQSVQKNTSRKVITQMEHLTFRGILPFSLTHEMVPLSHPVFGSINPTYPIGPWCIVILVTVLTSERRGGTG